MSTNEKIKVPNWKKIVDRLKSSVLIGKKKANLKTEIDYYRHYVYPTKLEDKVKAVVDNMQENRSTRA